MEEEKKKLYCPFCKNTKLRANHDTSAVRCSECGAQGPYGYTYPEAIKAWNTRTPSVTVDMEKHLQEAFSMGWNSCIGSEDKGGENRHIKFIMFLERYRSAIKDPSAIKEG